MITCPNGLVYNDKAGICSWPDEAKKAGCTSEGKLPIYSYNKSTKNIAFSSIKINRTAVSYIPMLLTVGACFQHFLNLTSNKLLVGLDKFVIVKMPFSIMIYVPKIQKPQNQWIVFERKRLHNPK